jgi:hypothetical protein
MPESREFACQNKQAVRKVWIIITVIVIIIIVIVVT